MADVKRMKPLFYEGKFNREERKIQVVYNHEDSNDKDCYRLWVRAGKPDNSYPRNESDQYSLYAEIRGYLVPLGMTEYRLTERCGYLPTMQELYGGAEHRKAYFDHLQGMSVGEAVAIEDAVISRLGKDAARQADFIHGILKEHLARYTVSKENGGETFPDYIGALMADELDHCMQLAKIYSAHRAQKDAARREEAAEQERAHRQAVNAEKEKVVHAALQTIRSGGTLQNVSLRYYKDDGTLVETSLILYLMREYHVNVPLRTQGWIKERLTTATVQEDFCGSVTYYRAKKSPCSQKFFDCMRELIQAVHDVKETAA